MIGLHQRPGAGRVLPYKGLMGMCHWMGLHFQQTHYYGVVHLGILGVRKFFIFTVRKRTRMFVL